jgi:hypothetical protein
MFPDAGVVGANAVEVHFEARRAPVHSSFLLDFFSRVESGRTKTKTERHREMHWFF